MMYLRSTLQQLSVLFTAISLLIALTRYSLKRLSQNSTADQRYPNTLTVLLFIALLARVILI